MTPRAMWRAVVSYMLRRHFNLEPPPPHDPGFEASVVSAMRDRRRPDDNPRLKEADARLQIVREDLRVLMHDVRTQESK